MCGLEGNHCVYVGGLEGCRDLNHQSAGTDAGDGSGGNRHTAEGTGAGDYFIPDRPGAGIDEGDGGIARVRDIIVHNSELSIAVPDGVVVFQVIRLKGPGILRIVAEGVALNLFDDLPFLID